ncbi:MAG: hypothetical protein NT133_18745, partial [Alphaproteobacteria bacterium]|nr:hypothetical protein [Alphaproteobacteria bacterium]
MSAVAQAAALFEQIRGISFFGSSGVQITDEVDLDRRLAEGALLLPLAYQATYVAPVRAGVQRLLALARQNRIRMSSVEIVTGGIYQHALDWPLGAELKRCVAVTSNLYRSFLDSARRKAAGMPNLGQTLPPLATFTSDGSDGPTTIPVDLMRAYLQAEVGVVGLPATMAGHPLLWMTLVHETAGHDVTHADAGLLDELGAALPAVLAPFRGQTGLGDAELTLLWSRWMDEATADIYALLNAGPAFGENLAVMLAAMSGSVLPRVRMESRADGIGRIDPHPTDILRLHLLLGGISALDGFSGRAEAERRLREIAAAFGTGDSIGLSGALPTGPQVAINLSVSANRDELCRCAEAVGRHIVTAPLMALGGHPSQRIETWDDTDHRVVGTIRNALAAGRPLAGLGDDAQFLAAATDAAMENAGAYDIITQALAAALDDSFRT